MKVRDALNRLDARRLSRAAATIESHLGDAGFSATWIKLNSTTVTGRANSDMDDAPAGICYEPRPRSTDVSDSTQRKATSGRRDPVAAQVYALETAISEAVNLAKCLALVMRRAENAAKNLTAIPDEEAQRLAGAEELKLSEADTRKNASCKVCQNTVSRTPNDRLRGGRCDACRMYLERHGVERPRDLWDDGKIKGRVCGHPVWVPGLGEQPCAEPFGHDGICTAAA